MNETLHPEKVWRDGLWVRSLYSGESLSEIPQGIIARGLGLG
jgi:hypothetical protein